MNQSTPQLTPYRLNCLVHLECEIQLINFGENEKKLSRLFCIKCYMDCKDNKMDPLSMIYIQDFILHTAESLKRIMNKEKFHPQNTIQKCLSEIDIIIKNFEDQIIKFIYQLKVDVQYFKDLVNGLNNNIQKATNFEQLNEKFQLISKMTTYKNTQEFQQIEKELDFISNNLHQINQSFSEFNVPMPTRVKIVQSMNQGAQILNTGITGLQKIVNTLHPPIFQYLQYTPIITDKIKDIDFNELFQLIEQGNSIQYKLIYKGTRDGLKSDSYYTLCNGRSNILTIIYLSSGFIIGGFSPCKLNGQLNGYVTDPTNKSFIFSVTKKQIYKIKPGATAAILSWASYGPGYGNDDFYFNSQFSSGTCNNLGAAFDISQFNITNKQEHLFGGNSSIVECDVYEVVN